MADDELSALRSQRLAQLQQQYQGGGQQSQQNAAAKEEEKAKEAEMRNAFLSRLLSQEARARLSTLAAAKPDKAKMVENMLVNMAKMGQIQGKLGEEDLKGLLEKVSEHTQKKTTVKFQRKRSALDDDDDY